MSASLTSVCAFVSFTVQYRIEDTSQVVLAAKNPPASTGDTRDLGLIPGSGRSPEGGHGNPRQYSCLENAMWTEEPGGLQFMGSEELDMA